MASLPPNNRGLTPHIAPAKPPPSAEVIENVLIRGDLDKLTEEQRIVYYRKMCESAGLNPLTQPFAYIRLSGRLTLYALRGATDQLRAIHDVSVEALDESERDGVFVVTARVRNGAGRSDMAKGAVNIANLTGEALANALMKAETKAKRRATLSLCGLAVLDETEVEDIPSGIKKLDGVSVSGPPAPPPPSPSPTRYVGTPPPPPPPVDDSKPRRIVLGKGTGAVAWVEAFIKAIGSVSGSTELADWVAANQGVLSNLETSHPDLFKRVDTAIEIKQGDFEGSPVEDSAPPRGEDIPDPIEDPDAAINFIAQRLYEMKTQEELELWWNVNVAPIEDKWFPPDFALLVKEFQRQETRIAAEEAK